MALISSSSRVFDGTANLKSKQYPFFGTGKHGLMVKMLKPCVDPNFSRPVCDAKAHLPLCNVSASGHEKGSRLIVAASTPRDDMMAPTQPLTRDDLIQSLISGCKPKSNWRIGTEHEKFGVDLKTSRRISYDQISRLLNTVSETFNWEKVMEGDKLIGLKQGKHSISLESGGQLELSGAPVETLHQTYEEAESHLYQVKLIGSEMGIGFYGVGFDPKWGLKDIPMIPKRRFEIIANYLAKVGSLGLDSLYQTCAVQVNVDFSSEADMIRKFRASLALQPIATAIFANSPFTEGKPNGYLSARSQTYLDTDNARTGMLPFVFDKSFGFERYVDYALNIPMMFVYRKKKHIDCRGMTFGAFMSGKHPILPGEQPTLSDWEIHLGTLWPEVRLKKYLEMRGADSGSLSSLCALPAFWVGLLYDEISLQNVLDMIEDWTSQERQMLRNQVPKTGLKTPFRNGFLRDIAEDVVRFAKDGLERRGMNETGFLKAVVDVVASGVTPAERLLEHYNGRWHQSVDPIFKELLY